MSVSQRPRRFAYRFLVQGLQHTSLVVDALLHLEPQRPRHEGELFAETQVVHVGPVGPGDLKYVSEAGRGHERRARTLAFGQRVDDHGGPVHGEADRLWVQARLADAVADAAVKLGWGGGGLGERDLAALFVECHQVGERASDVRGQADSHRASSTPFLRAASAPKRASSSSSQRPNASRSAMTLYFC